MTKPLTPLTDVLASLSQQSGVTILADDTVVDKLGVTTIDKPSVPEMLDAIKWLLPAISWKRVSIPGDCPIPDANTLSAEVRTLETMPTPGLIIADLNARTATSYSRTAPDPAPDFITPAHTIYLLTNETVRSVRASEKELAAVRQAPIDAQKMLHAMIPSAQLGMQTVANLFAQLTPDQQDTALSQMIFDWQRIIRSTNPSVLQKLQQSLSDEVGGTPFSLFPPPPTQGQ